jgi:hypothetical protein
MILFGSSRSGMIWMRNAILVIMIVVAHIAFSTMALAQVDEQQQALDAPENAYWYAPAQSWFVSSLGGGLSLERDGNGWITRFDENGNVIKAKWVDGLDAPTGMAAVDGRLYVGDRGVLVEIDIAKAQILRKIPLRGSEFVNDVAAAPNGDLYISDTFTDRIYRVAKGRSTPEIFVESPELEYPNGLWVDGNNLIVATWGPMTNRETFETSRPGTVKKVNLRTKAITPLGDGKPIANFDGIVKLGDSYFATDWVGGRLLKISPSGQVTEVLRGFKQLADLGVRPDTGVLGMPEMSSNRLFLFNVGDMLSQ